MPMFLCCLLVSFFFFKQKTAYEMRISDWSSDVCSSDLSRYGEREYFAGPESGTSLELSGFGAGIVGKKNFGDDGLGFYLGGRAGIVASKFDIEVSCIAGVIKASDDSIAAYVGVSAGYDFSTNLGLGLCTEAIKTALHPLM